MHFLTRFVCKKKIMSNAEEATKKKKAADHGKLLSWRQKKELADKEEMAIGKQLEELMSWTSMMDSMDDEQLKEYVVNRPESLQSVRAGKHAPGKKTKRSTKLRSSSSSSSQGLMAAVWKFHREDDDEASIAQA